MSPLPVDGSDCHPSASPAWDLFAEHPLFLSTGWNTEVKSLCLWEVVVLAGTRWSEKHSCLKFNFNVLRILFSLCMLQGNWANDSEWVRGTEKWKAKNYKQGMQWYILPWEITEKRLQGAEVGVWKWYVEVTTSPAQTITVLWFYIPEIGHRECSPGIYYVKILTANLTHPHYITGSSGVMHPSTLTLSISFYMTELSTKS